MLLSLSCTLEDFSNPSTDFFSLGLSRMILIQPRSFPGALSPCHPNPLLSFAMLTICPPNITSSSLDHSQRAGATFRTTCTSLGLSFSLFRGRRLRLQPFGLYFSTPRSFLAPITILDSPLNSRRIALTTSQFSLSSPPFLATAPDVRSRQAGGTFIFALYSASAAAVRHFASIGGSCNLSPPPLKFFSPPSRTRLCAM